MELDFRGYGIVKDLGKVGFIKGLLPGEEAIIKISFEKKNFFEGEIITLLSKSKYRVENVIDYDNSSLIHLDSLKQLEFQDDITIQSFLRNGISNFKQNPIISNDNYYHYRNKALFFVNNNPFIELGGYKEKSKTFQKISSLILAEPLINEILQELQQYYETEKIYYHDLSSIVMRSNGTQAMVIFVTLSKKALPKTIYLPLLDNEKVVSIYQNYRTDEKRNVGFENTLIRKNDHITEKLGDKKFIIYPNSFFQVNRDIAFLTYKHIRSLLSREDTVIDAFAGVSSIGQFVSDKVKTIYSIEIDSDSVKSARESVELNKITNLEIVKGDFNLEFNKYRKKANTLIIDPPRSGINDQVISVINNSNLDKIIYLSCNLRTLVRDIKLLSNYEVIEVTPIKMFYQTVEMETLVYLRRIRNDWKYLW